jgi:hypothetical protein
MKKTVILTDTVHHTPKATYFCDQKLFFSRENIAFMSRKSMIVYNVLIHRYNFILITVISNLVMLVTPFILSVFYFTVSRSMFLSLSVYFLKY